MTTVAHGPIDIGPTPIEVRFVEPVVALGNRRELAFEFERPPDSHLAAGIMVTLVTLAGRKEPFEGELDRRGEPLVCLVANTTAPEGAPPGFTNLEYRGVELSSSVPVRLRGLRWHGGE